MIKVGPALLEHAEQLERERGIPRDVVLSSLKDAMVAAYKRYARIKDAHGIICKLNERTGEIGIMDVRVVVEKVEEPQERDLADDADFEDESFNAPVVEEEDEDAEKPLPVIALAEARKHKADAEIGDTIEIDVTPEEFGRIAAQSAKQVITQRIREAEKMLVYKEFEEKKEQIATAIVQRVEGRNVVVSIGRGEAILPPREQLPGEYYRVGNKLRVYVSDIRDTGRVPQIVVSQAHPAMVREVFELEVPEIEDGLVEIKNIAREAGYRTKVAVSSNDPNVDPQGACIGTRGSRIQAIVNELKNEKIDIIRWSENPAEFITNALAPAKIIRVDVDADSQPARALVVVPDDQLSLAIGRDGQNVRLAAKLTGFKLDIKSYSQVQAEIPAEVQHEAMPEPAFAESDEIGLDDASDVEAVFSADSLTSADSETVQSEPETDNASLGL